MASVKMLMHNEFLLNRFIAVSGMRPNKRIFEKLWQEGVKFAAIAA
jgi:hypothetical protein